MADFPGLRAALGPDDEADAAAVKRLRRLFGRALIGKPPSEAEVLQALRGEQPPSLEEALRAAVNHDRFDDESEPASTDRDPMEQTLRAKLGIEDDEE